MSLTITGAGVLGLLAAVCWIRPSLTAILLSVAVVLTLMWVVDVIKYRSIRGGHPGPGWTTPFGLGALVTMVLNPVPFWTAQADYNRKGFSVNAMLGRFMVFVTDGDLCNHVFANVKEYVLFAHPNARYLFGGENLIYMDQAEHKAFRNMLLPGVYSKEALACYLACQEKACHSHLLALTLKGEVDARLCLRLMNAAASQESFVGPYLNAEQKNQLTEDILTFTLGFLSFPVAIPGSGLWKAIRARHRIRAMLTPIAKTAKEVMAKGGEPRCVMDFWAKEVVSRRENGKEDAVSNPDMASTVLDFFFASQDATTSAVVWALHLLTTSANGESVVRKMRKEVGAFLPADQRPALIDAVAPGTYIYTCALECLRAKPPVPMVPHLTRHEVTLDGKLKLPPGTMVIPSISVAAEHERKAGVFDPDSGAIDGQFNTTLVFGAGQHKCPGRMYAVQLLAVFMGVLVRDVSFKRRLTSESHNAIYLPTLVPADNWYIFEKLKH